MKTYAPIALGISIGIFSMPVAAKEPVNDNEKNTTVYKQAPGPSKNPSKIIRENSPANASSEKDTIDAETIKEKANTKMHVNPCNGSSPPSWC